MAIRQRNKPSAEFSLASISDIVFLLLIFFMVTSTFVNQSGVKIEYPESESNKPSDGGNTVTITAEDQYYWNSQLVDKGDIPNRIQEVLEDDNTENDVITLRVDKNVTYESSMVVLSPTAKFGGAVVIATKRP